MTKQNAVASDDAVTVAVSERRPQPSLIEWIVTAGFVVAGIVVLVDTGELEFQSQFGPGPRFFSVLIAVPLVAIAAARLAGFLAMSWRARSRLTAHRHPNAEILHAPSSEHLRFALLLLSMLAYSWLLEDIGFAPATLCLMLATLVILGRKPLTALAEATIATILLYGLFKIFLGVQLPTGEIEFVQWLGL